MSDEAHPHAQAKLDPINNALKRQRDRAKQLEAFKKDDTKNARDQEFLVEQWNQVRYFTGDNHEWVVLISALAMTLNDRGLLSKLDHAPAHLTGDNLDGYVLAAGIFREALVDHAKAVALLHEAQEFRESIWPIVNEWLRGWLREHVEGYWEVKHTTAENAPSSRQLSTRPATQAELDDDLHKYGRSSGTRPVVLTGVELVEQEICDIRTSWRISDKKTVDYVSDLERICDDWREYIGPPPRMIRPTSLFQAHEELDRFEQILSAHTAHHAILSCLEEMARLPREIPPHVNASDVLSGLTSAVANTRFGVDPFTNKEFAKLDRVATSAHAWVLDFARRLTAIDNTEAQAKGQLVAFPMLPQLDELRVQLAIEMKRLQTELAPVSVVAEPRVHNSPHHAISSPNDDLLAAENAAISLASDVVPRLLSMPRTSDDESTKISVAEILLASRRKQPAHFAAIHAVVHELRATRDDSVRFGSIVAATAHEAAIAFDHLISHALRTALLKWKPGEIPAHPSKITPDDTYRDCILKNFEGVRAVFAETEWPDAHEIVAAVHIEAAKAAERRQKVTPTTMEQTTPAARAIVLLLDADRKGERPTKKKLARAAGCSVRTLDRDPQFRVAWQAAKVNRRGSLPKGQIDQQGNVQAEYDPDEE